VRDPVCARLLRQTAKWICHYVQAMLRQRSGEEAEAQRRREALGSIFQNAIHMKLREHCPGRKCSITELYSRLFDPSNQRYPADGDKGGLVVNLSRPSVGTTVAWVTNTHNKLSATDANSEFRPMGSSPDLTHCFMMREKQLRYVWRAQYIFVLCRFGFSSQIPSLRYPLATLVPSVLRRCCCHRRWPEVCERLIRETVEVLNNLPDLDVTDSAAVAAFAVAV
jgi:hypothetical protein